MTDFRSLCAELHAAFNTYAVDEAHHDLLVRTEAALAQPETQGPTDEELIAAAEEAGLCYPTCWDLREGDAPKMQYLRNFARALEALPND